MACSFPFLAEDQPQADFCGRLECLTRREMRQPELARFRQDKEAKWLAVTRKRAEPLILEAKSRLRDGDGGNIPSGLAPFVDRPLVPLPVARRTAFEKHLRHVVQESFVKSPREDELASAPEHDPANDNRLANERPESAILNAACIACRGDCCLQGANKYAFISENMIHRFRWLHPEATSDEVAEVYLAALPDQSVEDSCVFHGDRGCTLPREHRSSICNEFLCWFRRELDDEYSENPGNGAVVVAIAKQHMTDPSEGAPFARVLSVSEDGKVTTHTDLTLPAVSAQESAQYRKALDAVTQSKPAPSKP
jgi:hypothetical protein